VKDIVRALQEYRAGLTRKGGPIASFLFLGPTGVGKTELAKVLARLQFGSEERMLRFDMSEYQDPKSLFLLIGSPDGSTRGALTDAVLQSPYSLVLLDEFEKAHPDILNIFLQVLDDGRLTDSLDRVVDFQNTIIIATSNAHSDITNEALSHSESIGQISEYLKRRLVDVFKPELLNRFSSIVVFKNLSLAEVQAVARVKIKEFTTKLLEEQEIAVTVTEAAVAALAKKGFDPLFGARPLRQLIDDTLRSQLATMILKGEVKSGDTVTIEAEGDTLLFKVVQALA
jgi:ATP-dependent Clp protease ATP-binding subunit ClpA